jgi:hypothetical protein
MRRWLIGVTVAVGALTLCVSAVAASKTYYTSGKRGKAPYISLTVSGGKVKTVAWWVKLDCGYAQHGPTHVNTRIKRNGRFNYHDNFIGGPPFDTEYDIHIFGRLNGTTATVTVDFGSSGLSQSVCEGKHTFHAVDTSVLQGRG